MCVDWKWKVESESQEVNISAVKVKVYKSRYPRWIFNLINFTAEPFYHLAGTICHPNSTSHKRKSSILIFHPQKNPFAICWREHQSCKTCKGGTPWKWKEFKALIIRGWIPSSLRNIYSQDIPKRRPGTFQQDVRGHSNWMSCNVLFLHFHLIFVPLMHIYEQLIYVRQLWLYNMLVITL